MGRKRSLPEAATTPAVSALVRRGVAHRLLEYPHDPRSESFGLEAAARLGIAPERVFKTLLVTLDDDDRRLAVAVLPVAARLALKRAAGALGARRAAMADVRRAERVTGYVAGGISPLGQRLALPTVLDASAFDQERILVSGGRRGLEIELFPTDLERLTDAVRADLRAGP